MNVFRFLTAFAFLSAVSAQLMAQTWDPVCNLQSGSDTPLQAALEARLSELDLDGPLDRGELAVTLLLLNDNTRPRLAQVNGNRMMYAASLPKIAILLGAAVALESGRLKLSRTLESDIHDMIRYSCNDCSNRVLAAVGPDTFPPLLQSERFAFYDASEGGGLWIGKEYGKKPAFARDPLHHLSHGATTFQVARFYCGVNRGTLVKPRQMSLMRDALVAPGVSHKFVKGLEDITGLDIYRKSGTWKSFHADSALVEVGDRAYVMVALARNGKGEQWMRKLAEPLHQLAVNPPPREPRKR